MQARSFFALALARPQRQRCGSRSQVSFPAFRIDARGGPGGPPSHADQGAPSPQDLPNLPAAPLRRVGLLFVHGMVAVDDSVEDPVECTEGSLEA